MIQNLIVGLVILSFPSWSKVFAQQILHAKPTSGIEIEAGPAGNQLSVKNSEDRCSIITLSGESSFELPSHIWVTEAVVSVDQRLVVMLLSRTRDNSPGLWSFGCLIAQVDETLKWRLKMAMMEHTLISDGIRRELTGIEDIANFPVVQFMVATREPLEGIVLRRSEKWNVVRGKRHSGGN